MIFLYIFCIFFCHMCVYAMENAPQSPTTSSAMIEEFVLHLKYDLKDLAPEQILGTTNKIRQVVTEAIKAKKSSTDELQVKKGGPIPFRLTEFFGTTATKCLQKRLAYKQIYEGYVNKNILVSGEDSNARELCKHYLEMLRISSVNPGDEMHICLNANPEFCVLNFMPRYSENYTKPSVVTSLAERIAFLTDYYKEQGRGRYKTPGYYLKRKNISHAAACRNMLLYAKKQKGPYVIKECSQGTFAKYRGNAYDINSVALSNNFFACGDATGIISLYANQDAMDLTKEHSKKIQAHTEQKFIMQLDKNVVSALCFDPDDANILCSGSQGGAIKIWDCRYCTTPTASYQHLLEERITSVLLQYPFMRAGCKSGRILTYDQRMQRDPLYTLHDVKGELSDIVALAYNKTSGCLHAATHNKVYEYKPSFDPSAVAKLLTPIEIQLINDIMQ